MRSALLVAALLLCSSCDRAGFDIDRDFSATLSGDVTKTYEGTASYEVTTPVSGAGEVIRITLHADGADEQNITIVDGNRQLDGPGSYPIGSLGLGGVFVPLQLSDATLDEADPTFDAISGMLEITEDDGLSLKGSFRARLAKGRMDSVVRATLEGTFSAPRVAATP